MTITDQTDVYYDPYDVDIAADHHREVSVMPASVIIDHALELIRRERRTCETNHGGATSGRITTSPSARRATPHAALKESSE